MDGPNHFSKSACGHVKKGGVSIHALVSSVGQAKLVKVFVTQLKRYGNTVD